MRHRWQRSAAAQGSAPPVHIDPPSARARTLGVTDKEIKVVHYWKGDRTRTSPYLRGTGLEAVVDEAQAFRAWIDYINAHADGGGDTMGFPFDLHGRKLRGVVIEAGSSAEDNVAAVTDVKAEKPFAAVAAPIAPSAAGIVAHMNDDHADAVRLYAEVLARVPDATEATMSSVDRYGFDLFVRTGERSETVRLTFDQRLDDSGQVRQEMIRLLARAREAKGASGTVDQTDR